tara:strand:- start:305 stop:853 length:549 start_codon:yes stop_codon:yes gene_type:complete
MVAPEVEAAFRTLVDAIAGAEPLPAGGAAGVTAIAMGIGLGAKVVRISAGSAPALAGMEDQLTQVLDRVRPEFTADCDAFLSLMTALQRPRDCSDRGALVTDAWRHATALPIAVASTARDAEALLDACIGHVKTSVAGDLSAALELVRAGRRIAASNARENAQRLPPDEAKRLLATLDNSDD